MIPADLIEAHRTWHDDLRSATDQAWDRLTLENEIEELVDVVAAVRQLPRQQASRDFVVNLREQLLAEAFQQALEGPAPVRPEDEGALRIPRPRADAPAGREDRRATGRSKVVRTSVAAAALLAVLCGADLANHWIRSGFYDGANHPTSIIPHPHVHTAS